MKKLSKEQAAGYLGSISGRESNLSIWLKSLEVGEALEISAQEWTGHRPPYDRINYVARKTGRTFMKGLLPGGKGWWVKRVEW